VPCLSSIPSAGGEQSVTDDLLCLIDHESHQWIWKVSGKHGGQ
jgi:hypothetical protein